MVDLLEAPRVLWLMVPAGPPVDGTLDGLVPLLTPGGHAIGTLSVFDFAPRTIADHTLRLLQTLGRQVVAMLELQKATRSDGGVFDSSRAACAAFQFGDAG